MEWDLNPGLLSPALDYFCCTLCKEGKKMLVGREEGKTLTAGLLYLTPTVSVTPW